MNVGEKRGLCPYFGSHGVLEDANVIFCPYNYIVCFILFCGDFNGFQSISYYQHSRFQLDPVIREQMGLSIQNSILIIDEAHNVEDVCRSSLTKSYTLEDLEITVKALDDLKQQKGRYKLDEDTFEAVSEMKCFMDMIMKWMIERMDSLQQSDYRNHRNVYPHPQTGKNKISELLKKEFYYDTKSCLEYLKYAKQIFGYFEDLKKDQDMPPTPDKSNGNALQTPSKRIGSISKFNPKASVVIEYLLMILFPKIMQFENDFVVKYSSIFGERQ